ncbi:putative Filament-forming protein (Tpr p270) protein [Seiridium cardinale]
MMLQEDYASAAPEKVSDRNDGIGVVQEVQHSNYPTDNTQHLYTAGGYGQNYAPAPVVAKQHHGIPLKERGVNNRIGGVRKRVFWPILVLVGLVVIGASVGGALGGMVGIRNNQASSAPTFSASSTRAFSTEASSNDPSLTGSPSSSAITTSGTTSTPTTTPDLAQTTDGCPASNRTTYAALNPTDSNPTDQVYTKYCGFDTDGNTLMGAYMQNFDLCVNLCNNWTYFQSDSSTKCTSLAFLPVGSPPNNCWAKTGTKLMAIPGNDAALLS